jgi:hypothetical protein
MIKVTVLTRGHSCEAAGLHTVRTERFCRRIAREQAGGDELRWYGSGYDDLPRECVLIPWQQPGGFFGNTCAPQRCGGCTAWKRCLCLTYRRPATARFRPRRRRRPRRPRRPRHPRRRPRRRSRTRATAGSGPARSSPMWSTSLGSGGQRSNGRSCLPCSVFAPWRAPLRTTFTTTYCRGRRRSGDAPAPWRSARTRPAAPTYSVRALRTWRTVPT